jgi:hypothetical protein
MTGATVPPVCPFCGADETLAAVDEERGETSASVAMIAGTALIAAGAIAAAALLLGGWVAWMLAGMFLLGLWQRTHPSDRAADPPVTPSHWYCPECERTFPA